MNQHSLKRSHYIVGDVMPDRDEALEYIQSMVRELRQMADTNGEKMIAYFLEMTYIETCDVIRREADDRQESA